MNDACRTVLLTVAAGVLTLPPPVATAADRTATAELAQCTAISAADARLACYDTIAGRAIERATPAVAAANATAVPAPAPVIATAVAPASKPVPPAAATAVLAPPVPAEDPRNFGFTGTQHYSTEQRAAIIQAIQARVAQVAADPLRSRYVVLDNGQTWVSTNGDMNLNAGEAVTIQRAALGSFMLTSASHHSYHVRRVR